MRITKKQLKRIIKEETKVIIAEGPAEELAAWMKKPLKSLPGAPEGPIAALSPAAKDLIKKGDTAHDGSGQDDMKIKGGVGGNIPLVSLKASQNEIGSAQSLANTMAGKSMAEYDGIDWGDPAWLLKMMKGTPTFKFKNPIMVAKTSDGFVVLDGHHRWSQATMINPNGKINAVGFDAGGMSADDMLQALHLGIYAAAGQAKTKVAKGANLLAGGEGLVRSYMDASKRKVDPQTLKPDPAGVPPYVAVVMKLEGITDLKQGYSAAEARAKEAIGAMKTRITATAPKRGKMPQADVGDNPGASASAVSRKLRSGWINYAPPFGGQAAATEKKPGALAETIRDIIKEILKENNKK